MSILKLKTDLRCGACVQAIKPLLDAEPGLTRWSADMASPDKVLTLEGDALAASRIDELLQTKGYCSELQIGCK